jgi:hypothetical protein
VAIYPLSLSLSLSLSLYVSLSLFFSVSLILLAFMFRQKMAKMTQMLPTMVKKVMVLPERN